MASVDNFLYTTSKKSGGANARFQYSEDYPTARDNVLEYDGADTKIEITSNSAFKNSLDSGGTWMAWIYPRSDGEANNGDIIRQRGSSSNTHAWWISSESAGLVKMNLLVFFSGTDGSWSSDVIIPINAWTHVAFTYDGSDTANDPVFYINGRSVTVNESAAPTGTIDDDSGGFMTIGNRTDQARCFDGYIADVRIYKGEQVTAGNILSYYEDNTDPTETVDGQWNLDDGSGSTATDSSGNGNNGTITSGTWVDEKELASIQAQWFNSNNDRVDGFGAYDFDGTNDLLTIADNNDFTFGNGTTDSAFSITAWINPDDLSSFSIISKNVASNQEWGFKFSPTDFMLFSIFDNSAGARLENSSTVAIKGLENKWTHVAATYSGSGTNAGMKIYLNGVQLSTTTNNAGAYTAMENKAGDVYIGHDPVYFGGIYADGRMSDVRVYAEELSEATIYSLYANSVEPSTTNLKGWWKLGNGATYELDSSGNGHTATVSGAAHTGKWYKRPAVGYGAVEDTDTLDFDGTNDNVTVSDDASISFGNGTTDSAFSLSAWIYMDDATQFFALNKRANNTQKEYSLDTTASDNLRMILWDESAGGTINIQSTLTMTHLEGRWIHVAGTYSGNGAASGVKLYLNGVQLTTTDNSSGSYTAMENGTGNMVMGRLAGGSTYSNGRIANATIWGDERTQAEIITEVERGYVDATGDADVVGHWPLNEGTGSTADNAEGTASLDGTISGPTWITDINRPVPAVPTQQTIDVSGLSFTDMFYYRAFYTGYFAEHNYALTEVTVDYTADTLRQLALCGVGI